MNRFLTKAAVGFLAVVMVCGTTGRSQTNMPRIGLVISDSLESTTRTLHGARKVIEREYPQASLWPFLLSGVDSVDARVIDSVTVIKPTLMLTVGSSATRFAITHFPDIPIVFAAVMYPVLSGFVSSAEHPGGYVTGASLNIPDDIQFKYFKRIVPGLKNVGVLYTDNTAALIPQAKIVAARMNMNLIPLRVNENKELPAALDSLTAVADGIWSVADPNLFNSKSTKYIIAATLRRQIPFMGFSRNVVESGALFSLDFDYKAVGFQAGGIACRVIKGEKPGDIAVTTTDSHWFHFNAKTADYINVKVPDELVAIAKEVYR
jgi:putative ABC transport system substrate-binding protein